MGGLLYYVVFQHFLHCFPTEFLEQDIWNRESGTVILEQSNWEQGTGQLGWGMWNRNSRTGHLEQYAWEHDSRTGHLEQDNWNRDSRTGLARMRFGMKKNVILIRKCSTRTMLPVMNGVSTLIGPTCM